MKKFLLRLKGNRFLYLLMLPGILYFLIFRYAPMGGLVVAFKEYNIIQGIFESPWVGLANFKLLFSLPEFIMVLRNTLLISFFKIAITLPIPIAVALMLNEVRKTWFKKVSQTVIFAPYMLSWVIIAGVTIQILSPTTGVARLIFDLYKVKPILIVATAKYFRSVIVISALWFITGWYVVFYLASISSFDVSMYEAATIDGATRWQQMFRITLPCLRGIIITLLILNLGRVMEAGFQQVFAFYSPSIRSTGEIIDTYVYSIGIERGNFSFASAVGLFKSIVNMVLVLLADNFAKSIGEKGLI